MSVHAKIRRQGGAAVVTLPPHVLSELGVEVGSKLDLAVEQGHLVARPVSPRSRRYALAELLEGSDELTELNHTLIGDLDGTPVGRELG